VPDWLVSARLCATNTSLLGSNFAALIFSFLTQILPTTQNPKAESYGMREDRSAWDKQKRYEKSEIKCCTRRAEQSRNMSMDDDIAAS
jgi:hypothetical protein